MVRCLSVLLLPIERSQPDAGLPLIFPDAKGDISAVLRGSLNDGENKTHLKFG